MTIRSMSRSTRNLAIASRSGTRPFIGTSLLEVTIRRPFFFTTSLYGLKTLWSTPTGTTVSRSSATPIWALMSILELCDTVNTAGNCFTTRLRVIERDGTIDGDRVVQRLEERPALSMEFQDARAHALVVVHDVEVGAPRGQYLRNSLRVGEGFPEPRAHHDGELGDVGERRELASRGNAKWVRIAVQIEPPNGREADALVQLRPGLTGEDLDAVTERDEFARQVTGVHALAAAARIAPVDEERHAVLSQLCRSRRHVGWQRDGATQRPGGLDRGDGFGERTGQGTTFF